MKLIFILATLSLMGTNCPFASGQKNNLRCLGDPNCTLNCKANDYECTCETNGGTPCQINCAPGANCYCNATQNSSCKMSGCEQGYCDCEISGTGTCALTCKQGDACKCDAKAGAKCVFG